MRTRGVTTGPARRPRSAAVATIGGFGVVVTVMLVHAWAPARRGRSNPTDNHLVPRASLSAPDVPGVGSRALADTSDVSSLARGQPASAAARPSVADAPIPSAPAWYERDGGPYAFEDLMEHWLDEAPDPEWSNNVTSFIYALLEPKELEHEVIRNVDCRTTLCRVQLDGRQMDALLRLNTSLTTDDHYPYNQQFLEEEGGLGVDVFIARDELMSRIFPR
jgi:hypothetical protein